MKHTFLYIAIISACSFICACQSGTQTLISDKQPVEFSIRASGVHLDQNISGKTVNHSDGSLSFGTQACPTIIWIKEVKDGNRLEIKYADGAVETYDRFTGVVEPAPFNPRKIYFCSKSQRYMEIVPSIDGLVEPYYNSSELAGQIRVSSGIDDSGISQYIILRVADDPRDLQTNGTVYIYHIS